MILTWSTGHAAGPPVEGVAGGNPDEAVDESDCDESSEDPEFDLIDLIDSTDVKTDEADVSVEATEATEATERRLYGLLTERREGALADEADVSEAKSIISGGLTGMRLPRFMVSHCSCILGGGMSNTLSDARGGGGAVCIALVESKPSGGCCSTLISSLSFLSTRMLARSRDISSRRVKTTMIDSVFLRAQFSLNVCKTARSLPCRVQMANLSSSSLNSQFFLNARKTARSRPCRVQMVHLSCSSLNL